MVDNIVAASSAELQPRETGAMMSPRGQAQTMVMIGQALRAWGLSVLTCVLLLVVWTVSQAALFGRWDSAWRNAMDVALGFGSVFAVVAATLHVPMFLALTILAPERLTRLVAALVGGALAPVVYLALAMAFNDEGPRTALEWVQYWLRNPWGFLAGIAPFALAGAVFGFAWVWRGNRVSHRRVEGAV